MEMNIIVIAYVHFHILVRHLSAATQSYDLKRQDELIRLVNSIPNSTWVAGRHNDVSSATSEPSSFHDDTSAADPPRGATRTKRILRHLNNLFAYVLHEFPPSFDARSKWSSNVGDPFKNCPMLRKVNNIGKCKGGWATSIASVVSDRLCISTKYKFRQPLSAQQLLSCCKDCCNCNGGDVRLGWEYVKHKGLVTGGPYRSNIGCQPYLMPPCERTYECSVKNSKIPECWENSCQPNEHNLNKTAGMYDAQTLIKIHISNYYSIPRKDSVRIMKELLMNGPLQVSMHVYEDFRVYTKGIYTHYAGDFVCDHGVKLIGWGVDNGRKYWLVMNSFGVLWGEQGLFKIAMDLNDNSDFGYAIIAPELYPSTAAYAWNALRRFVCTIIVVCCGSSVIQIF